MITRNNGYHGSSSGRTRWTEPNFEPVESEERVNCFLREEEFKKGKRLKRQQDRSLYGRDLGRQGRRPRDFELNKIAEIQWKAGNQQGCEGEFLKSVPRTRKYFLTHSSKE